MEKGKTGGLLRLSKGVKRPGLILHVLTTLAKQIYIYLSISWPTYVADEAVST